MYIHKRSLIKRILLCLFLLTVGMICSCQETVPSTKESDLYNEILLSVLYGDSELHLTNPVTINEVTDIYTRIYEYEPAVNGLSKSISYKKLSDDSDLITSIGFSYTLSKEEIIERHSLTTEKIDEALKNVPDNISFNVKLQKVVEVFTESLTYDDESSDCNTSYAAICKKSANCQGISKAFAMICEKLGYNTGYCIGELEGYPHMWNYIEYNDQRKQVDLTSYIMGEDKYIVSRLYSDIITIN